MALCNKNCAECPFPDCINDKMDADDYREAAERDKLLKVKSKVPWKPSPEKAKEYRRRFFQKHPNAAAEYSKRYYAKNCEQRKAWQKQYRRRKGKEVSERMKETMTELARRILGYRARHKLTQTAMADLLGIPASALQRLECGHNVHKARAFMLAEEMDKLESWERSAD